MSTVSSARPGGPPFAVDGKRVRITIGNGSGAEVMRGQLVSKSANWNIHSDILSYRVQTAGRADRTGHAVGFL